MRKSQALILTALMSLTRAAMAAPDLSEGMGDASRAIQQWRSSGRDIGKAPEPAAATEGVVTPPSRKEPILQEPTFFDLDKASPGNLLGSFALADRLDTHSDLFNLRLGAKDYDVSLASDPEFKAQYLAFRRKDFLHLHRIKNVNDLRGQGVDVTLDDKTTYNFKVSVNIFSPTRGSTLKIDPIRGTAGPSHKIKTGKILDTVEGESFIFKANGNTYWMLYGTDVDPATDELADTRSFLVVHENGLSTKAWPIAEGKLTAGKPLEVGLGDTRIVLVKTLAGHLRIHSPAKAVAVDYDLQVAAVR